MSRKVLVPEIEKLQLPGARQATPHVHAYLRDRILDGTLRPGTKLSQVTLAEQLGVSRTPLREVLRMLHEEGLVEIETNQRTRVSVLDPRELDEVYATRIALETLAVTVTVPAFDSERTDLATEQLADMRAAASSGDTERWFVVHSEFHRTITSGVSENFQRQLGQFADRCVRYIKIYQGGEPNNWHKAGDKEHEQILNALKAKKSELARVRLGLHLSRTALKVLKEVSPDYEPVAVPAALATLGVD